MSIIDREDRSTALDAFAGTTHEVNNTSLVPANAFSGPARRVFGAQPVAVKRDEVYILQRIKQMAAAAGEHWFYRYPVSKKIKNEETGKEEWVQDWIEGPSIKCATNVSRLYGNCDVDMDVLDLGSHWLYYARFMDLETGYSLVRPFQQRKNQKAMKTDSSRQEDIIFQIGVSKATRNVINNALEFFTNYAAEEAKRSIVSRIAGKIDYYRERVAERIGELGVEIKRVEIVRGRTLNNWLAPDIARTIAEIQAINDGMATADETWPAPGSAASEEQADMRPEAAALDEFADNGGAVAETKAEAGKPEETKTVDTKSTKAGSVSEKRQEAAATADAAPAEEALPKTEAEWKAYALKWIGEVTNAEAGKARWAREKNIRNRSNVSEEARDEVKSVLDKKIAELAGEG